MARKKTTRRTKKSAAGKHHGKRHRRLRGGAPDVDCYGPGSAAFIHFAQYHMLLVCTAGTGTGYVIQFCDYCEDGPNGPYCPYGGVNTVLHCPKPPCTFPWP
jgi:hypothetical protein